ncbi:MAG: nucleotidyltransferase domain-containing protein [Synergistaceae bacterium]|nr:nucleotidyltransferase domain-containing protein [Synergistaceae bacterium]
MLTIDFIKETVIPLAKKYDIVKIDLFGSYASGKANDKSDADFLVTFKVEVPSIFRVMGFKHELETSLNHPVDIVTLPQSRPEKLLIEEVVSIYEYAG